MDRHGSRGAARQGRGRGGTGRCRARCRGRPAVRRCRALAQHAGARGGLIHAGHDRRASGPGPGARQRDGARLERDAGRRACGLVFAGRHRDFPVWLFLPGTLALATSAATHTAVRAAELVRRRATEFLMLTAWVVTAGVLVPLQEGSRTGVRRAGARCACCSGQRSCCHRPCSRASTSATLVRPYAPWRRRGRRGCPRARPSRSHGPPASGASPQPACRRFPFPSSGAEDTALERASCR